MLNIRFLISILVAANFPSPLAFGDGQTCPELLVNANEKIFREFRYKELYKPGSWNPVDLYSDYSPNDIFIGIASGHTYFIVGDYRYDGGMNINVHRSKVRLRNSLTPRREAEPEFG